MSTRSDKIKALSDSVTEKVLAWQIGLPAPMTAVSELVKLAIAFGLGVWLL